MKKHFLHIGRTGGSVVKDELKDTDVKLHNHGAAMHRVDGEVIFFYRDPITRFASGFYSRKREGEPRYSYPHNKVEKRAFRKYDTPNDLALELAEFNEDALEAMRGIAHVNTHLSHWLKSIDYLEENRERVFFCGRQEHLNEDFQKLCAKLGIERELSDDPVDKHENPEKNYDFDPKARQALRDWYREDYKFVDYLDNNFWE